MSGSSRLIKRLENLLAEPFARVTYTEAALLLPQSCKFREKVGQAIDILIKESPKAKFQASQDLAKLLKQRLFQAFREVPVEWGMDLGSEHERHLAEKAAQSTDGVHQITCSNSELLGFAGLQEAHRSLQLPEGAMADAM